MGLRPINNIVDVSNYVLFATAQPIHTFDLAKVEGPRIIVRRAKKGETIRTLDGKDVESLSGHARHRRRKEARWRSPASSAARIPAITGRDAGRLYRERLIFDPGSVRRTRKALDIQTDASYRFERGADISFAPQAAVMAASLLTRFGGKVSKGMIDIYPKPRKSKEIVLRGRRIADLLGVDVDDEFVERTLGDLGFALKATSRASGVSRCRSSAWISSARPT